MKFQINRFGARSKYFELKSESGLRCSIEFTSGSMLRFPCAQCDSYVEPLMPSKSEAKALCPKCGAHWIRTPPSLSHWAAPNAEAIVADLLSDYWDIDVLTAMLVASDFLSLIFDLHQECNSRAYGDEIDFDSIHTEFTLEALS